MEMEGKKTQRLGEKGNQTKRSWEEPAKRWGVWILEVKVQGLVQPFLQKQFPTRARMGLTGPLTEARGRWGGGQDWKGL